MATVTIRNVDDKIVERLKERATQNHRFLEAEVRQILAETAEQMTREEFIELADRIRAMTAHVPQTDSAQLIREDRDMGHGKDL